MCSFTSANKKTRRHNHVTGKYLFPTCSNCNLALKPRKCRITSSQKVHNFIGCGGNGGGDADDNGGSGGDGGDYNVGGGVVAAAEGDADGDANDVGDDGSSGGDDDDE